MKEFLLIVVGLVMLFLMGDVVLGLEIRVESFMVELEEVLMVL